MRSNTLRSLCYCGHPRVVHEDYQFTGSCCTCNCGGFEEENKECAGKRQREELRKLYPNLIIPDAPENTEGKTEEKIGGSRGWRMELVAGRAIVDSQAVLRGVKV